MKQLDELINTAPLDTNAQHQGLLDAFELVAIELRWDGFAGTKVARLQKLREELQARRNAGGTSG